MTQKLLPIRSKSDVKDLFEEFGENSQCIYNKANENITPGKIKSYERDET